MDLNKERLIRIIEIMYFFDFEIVQKKYEDKLCCEIFIPHGNSPTVYPEEILFLETYLIIECTGGGEHTRSYVLTDERKLEIDRIREEKGVS